MKVKTKVRAGRHSRVSVCQVSGQVLKLPPRLGPPSPFPVAKLK